MSELVIEFGNTGNVASMHMDCFDLGFLGDKKVYRQTSIEFNTDTQHWDIVYLGTNGINTGSLSLSGFATYDSAREFEVLWLNDCRLLGLYPVTEGLEIADDLREGYGS